MSIYLGYKYNLRSYLCDSVPITAYRPISALLVSEKLVYRFQFLVLCWLTCFSNTRFTPPFASQVATVPIPVSLWLGSHVVKCRNTGTHLEKNSFWRTMELILPPSQLWYTRSETSITVASPGTASYGSTSVNHTYQERLLGQTATATMWIVPQKQCVCDAPVSLDMDFSATSFVVHSIPVGKCFLIRLGQPTENFFVFKATLGITTLH